MKGWAKFGTRAGRTSRRLVCRWNLNIFDATDLQPELKVKKSRKFLNRNEKRRRRKISSTLISWGFRSSNSVPTKRAGISGAGRTLRR